MPRQAIIFKNTGLIETRAITTIGVSVKESDNPFGYFGTGLKYAIGILLRNGCSITIHRGLERLEFGLTPTKIRGETFSIVTMNGRELGFTSQIGKNWELWMAYRELYCNTLDEGGDVYIGETTPEEDMTHISVMGEAFEQIHHNRRDFILQSSPIETCSMWHTEFHDHPSMKGYFFKGILVGGAGKKTLITYNFLENVVLTEDRTVKSPFDCEWNLVGAIKRSENSYLIEKIVTAGEAFQEGEFRFSYNSGKPSDTFLEVVTRLSKDDHPDLSESARQCARQYVEEDELVPIDLTKVQLVQLDKAKAFTRNLNLFREGEFTLIVVETLGRNILGQAKNGYIYLSQDVFEMGTKMVAITLIEEYIHLKHGHSDMSRNMQNLLFNKIITLGEELMGEPL